MLSTSKLNRFDRIRFSISMMSEISKVKKSIAETEGKLKTAEDGGNVELIYMYGSTASQDVDHKTFPLYIDILHKVGLETPYEQYTLYGTLGAFMYGAYTPMRKAFYLNKWLHESDESLKDIGAARVNMSAAEQKGGERYLQELRKVPQRFAVLPLSFLLIEGIRVGYRSLSGVFTRRP